MKESAGKMTRIADPFLPGLLFIWKHTVLLHFGMALINLIFDLSGENGCTPPSVALKSFVTSENNPDDAIVT